MKVKDVLCVYPEEALDKEAALFPDHIRNKGACIYIFLHPQAGWEQLVDPCPLGAVWIHSLQTSSFPKTFHRLYKYPKSLCFFKINTARNKGGKKTELLKLRITTARVVSFMSEEAGNNLIVTLLHFLLTPWNFCTSLYEVTVSTRVHPEHARCSKYGGTFEGTSTGDHVRVNREA